MKKNVIVGQSGGPTAVINASLYGVVYEALMQKEQIGTVYGMINGIEGFLADTIMNMNSVEQSGELELIKTTPGSFLGSCRYKLPEDLKDDVYPLLFKKFEEYSIGYFFYIGGNDSMDTVSKLSRYAAISGSEICFIGIPKTIDNDLVLTDHTPGFGSAAKYVASTVREIAIDASVYDNKKSVTIVEIMGRHAGWLTAAAALSRGEDCEGPDMIYLPEADFDMDDFMARVKKLSEEKSSVVIAVSEGIKLADGRFVCELGSASDYVDAFGHKQLSGCAVVLTNKIQSELGLKSRAIEYSTLQRAATHLASLTDINEAFTVGYLACKAADEGKTGMMVTIEVVNRDPYEVAYNIYDIHAIANVERPVPAEWIVNNGTDVSEEYVKYARPLIMGELTPMMVEGLPRHLVLNKSTYRK